MLFIDSYMKHEISGQYEGWSKMTFKVHYNPNHSMILWNMKISSYKQNSACALQATFPLPGAEKPKASMKTFPFHCLDCAWSPSSRPPLFWNFLWEFKELFGAWSDSFCCALDKNEPHASATSHPLQDTFVIPAPPWDGRRQDQENHSGSAGRARWPPALLRDGCLLLSQDHKAELSPFRASATWTILISCMWRWECHASALICLF